MSPTADYVPFVRWPVEVEWGLMKTGQVLGIMIILLLTLAFILLFDRKVWAAVQLRKGPNVVGPFGLLQSFADFFKFVFKEIVIPAGANKTVFILAPLLTFVLAFIGWAVVPFANNMVIADLNVGILYLFAISSLGVYGIIMGGWASNSKYPFLGGLRSAAQMVSYEVSIGFIIITVLLLVGSLNLTTIVENQRDGIWMWHGFRVFNFAEFPYNILVGIVMFVMMGMFFISALAETNRPPFDLPEAESELVAGYQVEYSSTPYLLFMIGEYLNIVLMCAMIAILFLGGWHLPWGPVDNPWLGFLIFYAKIWFIFFLFAMVKAIVPRYRYDQLMRIGWKIFLPTSLIAVAVIAAYVVYAQPAGAGAWAAALALLGRGAVFGIAAVTITACATALPQVIPGEGGVFSVRYDAAQTDTAAIDARANSHCGPETANFVSADTRYDGFEYRTYRCGRN